MSLYKQLWLAILALLTAVFSVSFLVTTVSAKAYLEQQLSLKNADNATALALSLTQQGADKVLMELTLSAQFDTGHYELIELSDPEGNPILRRAHEQPADGAPAWFIKLVPIEVEPGIATVQAGWRQAGTLLLRSHSRFAYRELWQNTLMLAVVFLLAGLAAGIIGKALLRRILRPLDDVIGQAEAIAQRRFITIAEPGTREFRQIVAAMNNLSNHVKTMLGQEARRLQKWQREAHIDSVTGLTRREPFLGELEAHLDSDDVNAAGCLCLVRIAALRGLNLSYGRKATDAMLHDIGAALNSLVVQHNDWSVCRLNGSDFALLAAHELDAREVGHAVRHAVEIPLEDHGMAQDTAVHVVVTAYEHRETPTGLLTRLDGALVAAQGEERSSVTLAHAGEIAAKPVRQQMEIWREMIEQGLRENRFSLAHFPLHDRDGQLLHRESPARLEWHGEHLTAGQFLPWLNRLGLSAELDRQVVDLAMTAIAADGEPVAVNLTVAAVADGAFLDWLEQTLTRQYTLCEKLWLELPESLAFRHLDHFKRLSARVKFHGAHMGIDHMGHQIAELGQLHDVGLDYLKVDARFVRNIHDNPGNQTLLRTLCTLGHSIGVRMLAEGVQNEAEWQALRELGMDGATGPAIR